MEKALDAKRAMKKVSTGGWKQQNEVSQKLSIVLDVAILLDQVAEKMKKRHSIG